MTRQQILEPFFQPCINRLIPGQSFADYQAMPGFNASLLKEATTYEALEKLMAMHVLPADLQRLLELTGGDSSDAIGYAEEQVPRTEPRPFVRFLSMPDSGIKVSKPQQKVMDLLWTESEAAKNAPGADATLAIDEVVERCKTTQAVVTQCLAVGWAELSHKEVPVSAVSDSVKETRTKALLTGDAIHVAILEPNKFDTDKWHEHWQICPTKSLTSVAAMEAQASDPRRLITPEIVNVARRARDAVYDVDECNRVLKLPGKAECSAQVWDTELLCVRKARFDWLPDDRAEGIFDIKSTRTKLKQSELEGEIRKHSYGIQKGFYKDTLQMHEGGEKRESFIIWVRNEAPFIARCSTLTAAMPEMCYAATGAIMATERLAAFCYAAHTNTFEAYEHEAPVVLCMKGGPR